MSAENRKKYWQGYRINLKSRNAISKQIERNKKNFKKSFFYIEKNVPEFEKKLENLEKEFCFEQGLDINQSQKNIKKEHDFQLKQAIEKINNLMSEISIDDKEYNELLKRTKLRIEKEFLEDEEINDLKKRVSSNKLSI
ncbi:hypothetical protein [Mycoplasma phocoenae]|uniref:Uncharacterized protein n=1 Tax=Mycoplasma phocoenae TaxID=754517 RepID=A0A858U897_9MOLU|nr:hypothetical protein [Mycoplasma phocoenae]QJG66978.1 hypothetical protein HGG69_01415 [Mycoplasma phocoenae]